MLHDLAADHYTGPLPEAERLQDGHPQPPEYHPSVHIQSPECLEIWYAPLCSGEAQIPTSAAHVSAARKGAANTGHAAS